MYAPAMRSVVAARHLTDFADRVLVDCPRCGGPGVVELRAGADGAAMRRMTCERCATVLEAAASSGLISMGLPLRLTAETRHGPLTALNEAHLDYMETYLAGTLREERVDDAGVRNRSVISRLPRWMKLARNRDEALKAIARARARRR